MQGKFYRHVQYHWGERSVYFSSQELYRQYQNGSKQVYMLLLYAQKHLSPLKGHEYLKMKEKIHRLCSFTGVNALSSLVRRTPIRSTIMVLSKFACC